MQPPPPLPQQHEKVASAPKKEGKGNHAFIGRCVSPMWANLSLFSLVSLFNFISREIGGPATPPQGGGGEGGTAHDGREESSITHRRRRMTEEEVRKEATTP